MVELAKPLAVMKRSPPDVMEGGEELPDHDADLMATNQSPSWDIVAIVRRKMVFAKRPMPMVGKGAMAVAPGTSS